jgi:cob(I)alamin adenosyltransferase
MKIYTGKGDKGKTSLFSGELVSKSSARIEAYGDLDELNSVVGALLASLPEEPCAELDTLKDIQTDLLHLGSWLATSPGSRQASKLEPLDSNRVLFLEESIDRLQRLLPALHEFILPGGHTSSAWAHIARTVCRRVERRVVALKEEAGPDGTDADTLENGIVYLNRLSDYFFVMALWCNLKHGMSDTVWDE